MADITKVINKLVKEVAEERKEVVLTDDQKKLIIDAWRSAPNNDPPSLKELTNLAFPNMDLDGRSLEGQAVKQFLASFGVKPPVNVHQIIGPHELTVAEKEFIQNNIDAMRPLEMCKTLWPTISNMCPLSRECLAVKSFIDSLKVKPGNQTDFDIQRSVEALFSPPKNYTECLKLVNRYNHDILSTAEISEQQKQGIFTLIRYLHSPRFLKTISTFHHEENRALFLSEFIRATYDKPDLSVDELNLYISLAASYPLEQIALEEREALSRKLQQETEDGRISQATVEAINAKNDEYKECQVRQEKLVRELNGSRAKRIDKQLAANTSILPLIKYWQEEKNRKNFIALAKIKESARIKTTEQLMTVESVVAEIYGAVEEY